MMKPLIVYYSYSGNTKSIAEMIHSEIGSDIAEIQTVAPYKGDYNAVVEQGKKEVDKGYCPEIKPLGVDLSRYDTVVIGTPVWWYTFAPAVKTFLCSTDFSGKSVYTFATNGGWIGHTLSDVEKACKNATVNPGIDIYFSGGNLRTPESEIKTWARNIK